MADKGRRNRNLEASFYFFIIVVWIDEEPGLDTETIRVIEASCHIKREENATE